jgi:hypothetical protein
VGLFVGLQIGLHVLVMWDYKVLRVGLYVELFVILYVGLYVRLYVGLFVGLRTTCGNIC